MDKQTDRAVSPDAQTAPGPVSSKEKPNPAIVFVLCAVIGAASWVAYSQSRSAYAKKDGFQAMTPQQLAQVDLANPTSDDGLLLSWGEGDAVVIEAAQPPSGGCTGHACSESSRGTRQ